MDWLIDVAGKLKRKNAVLFSKENELIKELGLLVAGQNRRVLILWALDLAEESVSLLEQKYPEDSRPRNALEATRLWASGSIKMPLAKREILNCHAMAKELNSPEDIALCHAIGQACSVVHTSGHASGYPIYELTAIVRRHGIDNCKEHIDKRFCEYKEKLLYWQTKEKDYPGTWAKFLLTESKFDL